MTDHAQTIRDALDETYSREVEVNREAHEALAALERVLARYRTALERARDDMLDARDELGVPTGDYPAPVALCHDKITAGITRARAALTHELTDAEVRNAALCLLAADWALCDDMDPESAIAYSRRLEASLDEEPWSNGRHEGDCTSQPFSCTRCIIEEAERQARERYES